MTLKKRAEKVLKNSSKRMSKISRNAKIRIVGGLTLLLIVGLLASRLMQPETEPAAEQASTSLMVETFTVGGTQLNEQTVGAVEQLSSITLVAQAPGPVSKVAVSEGDEVWRGELLSQQASNYAGGNSAAIGAALATKQYQLADETLKSTVETVTKTRELADASRNNTEELRKISASSIEEAKKLQGVVGQVIERIQYDIQNTTDDDIAHGLRQQLISYQGVYNQTTAQLQNLEYATDLDSSPETLANLNKDLVYQSTEIQLKSAEIGLDIARLNMQAAQIAAGMMRTVAPFSGIIERIYVTPGEYVNPGQPIAKLVGSEDKRVVVRLSGSLAARVDVHAYMQITIDETDLDLTIDHLTGSPTAGSMFEIIATLPEPYASNVYEGSTVDVRLPLLPSLSSDETQFVPLDAVFVTNTDRFVYLLEEGVAVKRSVTTGAIVGSTIEVTSGLSAGELVILNRQITNGQAVEQL